MASQLLGSMKAMTVILACSTFNHSQPRISQHVRFPIAFVTLMTWQSCSQTRARMNHLTSTRRRQACPRTRITSRQRFERFCRHRIPITHQSAMLERRIHLCNHLILHATHLQFKAGEYLVTNTLPLQLPNNNLSPPPSQLSFFIKLN